MQKNILEYLENTALTHKDKLAFSNGKEGLTFSEVYSRSRSIGSFLANKGHYREPIAIIMDKHPNTLTAFFGTVYAGCFYACIDEKMPEARILAILKKLNPSAIICDAKNSKTANALGISNVYLYDADENPIYDLYFTYEVTENTDGSYALTLTYASRPNIEVGTEYIDTVLGYEIVIGG